MRLRLKDSEGKVEWYDAANLSPKDEARQKSVAPLKVEPQKVEPVKVEVVKHTTKIEPKVVEKPTGESVDASILIKQLIENCGQIIEAENIEDLRFFIRCIKYQLRILLKEHGWKTTPDMKWSQILMILDQHVGENKEQVKTNK